MTTTEQQRASGGRTLRRTIPLILTGIVTLGVVYGGYFNAPGSSDISRTLNTLSLKVFTISAFVGVLALFLQNVQQIRTRASDWPYRLLTLSWMVVTVVLGQLQGMASTNYNILYNYTIVQIGLATGALAYLWTAYGAWKGAQIRSLRSAIFAFGALFGTLLLMPFASALGLAYPSYWLAYNLNSPRKLIMDIVTGAGGVLLSVRALLGWERGYLSE